MRTNYTDILSDFQERIKSGVWPLGALIPNEAELAAEFGCSRSTVNRALQFLADTGMVERKRKAGTRVRQFPQRIGKFEIPVIRHQIESLGKTYHHVLLERKTLVPPKLVMSQLRMPISTKALKYQAIHLGDDQPFAFEDRWINMAAVPNITKENFHAMSANEWLVKTVPYSNCNMRFSAANARQAEAEALGINEGNAVLRFDRTTWRDEIYITYVQTFYQPTHAVNLNI